MLAGRRHSRRRAEQRPGPVELSLLIRIASGPNQRPARSVLGVEVLRHAPPGSDSVRRRDGPLAGRRGASVGGDLVGHDGSSSVQRG